ncbi:F-box domain, FBD domain, Leucine-rich repeat domain, L domain-like protein [Artemisia annua]|uniref:F-box domain, FBD domain, Leucine-rich repeat domain, L domain-like protein n=1 Tax=Artemisia annua TaxID=35608 RepID=A0A2U1LN37_ARTAN|nr:F-box domain, FBD domain, Leucine-rich repeat domain, L domain-like protein [Artemisia annua]
MFSLSLSSGFHHQSNKMASNLKNEVDFISNMPDPVLELILQRLPTTEVVRTSVLSTRWRYLWTSIPLFPSLNIDFYHALRPPYITNKQAKPLIKFVSWALANKTVDLDSFRLCCVGYFGFSTVEMLIKAAVNRNVKSLDLKFYPKPTMFDGLIGGYWFDNCVSFLGLPDYLVSCKSLESLRLSVYQHAISLDGCKRFERLKVLELNNVYCYEGDSVETFLEKCPLLEDLSLIDCLIRIEDPICISSSKLKTLIIRNWKNVLYGNIADFWCGLKVCCPKLLNFEYVGRRGELILEDVDSLKKAVIHPEDMLQQKISPTLGKTVSKLLGGISHVDSLSLNLYFVQCIDATNDPQGDFPASFPNLKTLELTTTIDAFTMKVLIHILRCSPNLECLRLIIQKELLTSEHWELDEVEARGLLTRHLKRVEFLELNGEEHKLGIARLLLEHGYELKEMVFSWSNEVSYHEKSGETMNEVSECHKSSTVKLIALLKD